MDKYLVLIGDIKGSKNLLPDKRKEIQQKLNKLFEDINKQSSVLVSPFTITLGDEFQAVYQKADDIFYHSWLILSALHPVKVRFSYGVGTLSTPVNEEQAIGMDGPAFYAARKGMDQLKDNEYLYRFIFHKQEGPILNLINESLHLISVQIREWNKNRMDILPMLKDGVEVKEIKFILGISETAIYKNRKTGSLETIIKIADSISEYINQGL